MSGWWHHSANTDRIGRLCLYTCSWLLCELERKVLVKRETETESESCISCRATEKRQETEREREMETSFRWNSKLSLRHFHWMTSSVRLRSPQNNLVNARLLASESFHFIFCLILCYFGIFYFLCLLKSSTRINRERRVRKTSHTALQLLHSALISLKIKHSQNMRSADAFIPKHLDIIDNLDIIIIITSSEHHFKPHLYVWLFRKPLCLIHTK